MTTLNIDFDALTFAQQALLIQVLLPFGKRCEPLAINAFKDWIQANHDIISEGREKCNIATQKTEEVLRIYTELQAERKG